MPKCQISEPKDNPFCEKSNPRREKERERRKREEEKNINSGHYVPSARQKGTWLGPEFVFTLIVSLLMLTMSITDKAHRKVGS